MFAFFLRFYGEGRKKFWGGGSREDGNHTQKALPVTYTYCKVEWKIHSDCGGYICLQSQELRNANLGKGILKM
jgi:hypothetical protein